MRELTPRPAHLPDALVGLVPVLLEGGSRFLDAGDRRRLPLPAARARELAAGGVLEGSKMALTFNMLRANDLIWSFVVNNYLLGKEPVPFDLLYWNSDTTRMPPR